MDNRCLAVLAAFVIAIPGVGVATAADGGGCPPGTTGFDECQTGTGGDDNQIGTDGNDSQVGAAGSDLQRGGAGNDTQDGGPGDDVQSGGLGNDLQDGGPGSDAQTGDSGNDVVSGGPGNDRIDGGPGNDVLGGGTGSDTIVDRFGANLINGDGPNGSLSSAHGPAQGRAGNDVIFAQDGAQDRINCGGGRDRVYADRSDRLRGCENVIYKKTKAPSF